MRFFLFILIFLFLGAMFIISNENIHLKNSEGLSKFTVEYSNWLNNLFENTKTVTGYVAKLEWLPSGR